MRINGKKGRTLMEAVVVCCKGLVWLSYVRIRKTGKLQLLWLLMWTGFRAQLPKYWPDVTGQHVASRQETFYFIVVVAAVFQIIQSIRAA